MSSGRRFKRASTGARPACLISRPSSGWAARYSLARSSNLTYASRPRGTEAEPNLLDIWLYIPNDNIEMLTDSCIGWNGNAKPGGKPLMEQSQPTRMGVTASGTLVFL